MPWVPLLFAFWFVGFLLVLMRESTSERKLDESSRLFFYFLFFFFFLTEGRYGRAGQVFATGDDRLASLSASKACQDGSVPVRTRDSRPGTLSGARKMVDLSLGARIIWKEGVCVKGSRNMDAVEM
jgi:hypothetical protein